MLGMELGVVGVVVVSDETAPLLDAYIVIAPIERIEGTITAHFKKHLRVAHGIAVLFAIVTNRDRGKSARPGFVGRFDH